MTRYIQGPSFVCMQQWWYDPGTTRERPSVDHTLPGAPDPMQPPMEIEPGAEPEPLMVGAIEPPPGPLPHDRSAPREVSIAMARMQQLGGETYQGFKRRDLELLGTMMKNRQALM